MTSVLRITTAGSVDDGKSTLIGRLLYEGGAVYDDQLQALERSKKIDGDIDLSLLADGLKAEREQGITIDVAYKYFKSATRKYILSDAPGHLQYTRNMVTAASRSDVTIILVDAKKGVLEQTRRHAYLAAMLGVPHVIVAVNKIDTVGYDDRIFLAIEDEFRNLPWISQYQSVSVLPVSALKGDNIVTLSAKTPYYTGLPLLDLLDEMPVTKKDDAGKLLTLPVQAVVRNHNGARWILGTIAEGQVSLNTRVSIDKGKQETTVAELYVAGKAANVASSGDAVAVKLSDNIDVARGSLLHSPEAATVKHQGFGASLVWFDGDALRLSKPYIMRIGTVETRAIVKQVHSRFDLESLAAVPTISLAMNDVAEVDIETLQPVFVRKFSESQTFGAFILIDPHSHRTVAAGMVRDLSAERGKAHAPAIIGTRDEWLSKHAQCIFLPHSFFAVNGVASAAETVLALVQQGYRIVAEPGQSSERALETLKIEQRFQFSDGLGI